MAKSESSSASMFGLYWEGHGGGGMRPVVSCDGGSMKSALITDGEASESCGKGNDQFDGLSEMTLGVRSRGTDRLELLMSINISSRSLRKLGIAVGLVGSPR